MSRVDVAVVGAGPAGLRAALAAAAEGVSVVAVNGYANIGGQYYCQSASTEPSSSGEKERQFAALQEKLARFQVNVMPETAVLSLHSSPHTLWLHGPHPTKTLTAGAIILATGAYDRTVPFPGWTLPGVLAVGAVQSLLKKHRILPGKRILLAGSGPLLLVTAAALVKAGAAVVGIIEGSAPWRVSPARIGGLRGQKERLREGANAIRILRQHRVPVFYRHAVTAVEGNENEGVAGAVISRLDRNWHPQPDTARYLSCDTIAVGFGFLPETALGRLAGAAHHYDPALGGWIPQRDPLMQTTQPGLFAVGDGAGVGGAPLAELEGQIAGLAAAQMAQGQPLTAGLLGKLKPLRRRLRREQQFQRLYASLYTPGPGIFTLATPETTVCRCENVPQKRIAQAIAAGAGTVTAVKGLTRCGMGLCQGRYCAHTVAALIAQRTGKPAAAAGQDTPRAPIIPYPLDQEQH